MFDVLTTGAVVAELRRTVLDGRIQRLGLVDAVSVGIEIYAQGRRRHLIASADPRHPRIHLTNSMPSTDPSLITPFGLQLRKYVRGGFLIGIDQPPLERVIRLSIAKRMAPLNEQDVSETKDDDADTDEDDIWSGENISRLDLMVEIMGRHSNLVLVDEEGVVRESAKRVTPSMSRVRPVLPKTAYTLPPPPDKPDPRQVTSPTMTQFLGGIPAGTKFAEALVRGFRGVSPQIGREVAFRLTGDAQAKGRDLKDIDSRELAQTIRGMFQTLLTGDWEPHVYETDSVAVGYGAIPIRSLVVNHRVVPMDSVSEAIEQAEGAAGEETPQDHAQRRARLIQAIDSAIGSVDSRLRSLRQQHERSRDTERLRRWGDAIYSYLWQIQPGDTELVAETVVGEETIPLDSARSPKDMAQEYFEEYRKSQKAGETIPERIEQGEHERDYLEQLRTQVQQAEGFGAIEALRYEFEEQHGKRHPVKEQAGHKSSKKRGTKKVSPVIDDDGNLIYIGRSGRENEQVTFEIAGSDDWWLHARGVPGSHVILRLRMPAAEPDEDAVETAASIAGWYSKSRDSGTVEVDVTQRRHVRKIKGAGPGMVTYRNERTIAVQPMDEEGLRKTGRVE